VNNPLSADGVVTVTVNAPSGLFNNAFQSVKVYPNPTNGNISIYYNSSEVRTVQLLNIQGQLVQNLNFTLQGGMINADLKAQNIPHGMYWIVVEDSNNTRGVAKVIFQN
jgi:hypothetical protein